MPKAHEINNQKLNQLIRKKILMNLANLDLTTELVRDIRNYCSNNPVMLDPSKLHNTIWLKKLAYYLSISEKKYINYGEIDYKNELLIHNAISIHKLLMDKLNDILDVRLNSFELMTPADINKIKTRGVIDIAVYAIKPTKKPYYSKGMLFDDIVSLQPDNQIPDHWSIEVTKELALKIISAFNEFDYLFNAVPPKQNNNGNNQSQQNNTKNDLSPSLIPSSSKTKRSTPIDSQLIYDFVKYLIDSTSDLNTFTKFESAMKNDYLFTLKNKLSDDEKYNEAPMIKRVYCVKTEKDSDKYLIHYSKENNIGKLIPQKPYSLSSFNRIFKKVSNEFREDIIIKTSL